MKLLQRPHCFANHGKLEHDCKTAEKQQRADVRPDLVLRHEAALVRAGRREHEQDKGVVEGIVPAFVECFRYGWKNSRRPHTTMTMATTTHMQSITHMLTAEQ